MKAWYRQEPFVHLSNSVIRELSRTAQGRRYPKGAVLFREGEPADVLWVIQRGWVSLMKKTTDGKILTLDLVTPKDSLCGLSVFSGDKYLSSAVAVTPVEVRRIPASVVRKALRSNAPFAFCVAGIFSQRFHHMAAAYATAFAPVEQRITAVLLRLSEDFGNTLPVTRREVAELAGTTVETAIRVTRKMWREHLLLMRRGEIILVNPKGLARRIQTA
jgi:CRP-like cAMP-binding protein